MSRDLTENLARWLAEGRAEMGEIAILGDAAGGYELRHRADLGVAYLSLHHGPDAARPLANLDAANAFRPLKTAPNLRRGWRLILRDLEELRRALDYFYPAMLGVWRSFENGALQAVPLRTTLDRQTGMYRITQKLTDEQARPLVDGFCSGCLKCRLWDGQTLSPDAPGFPLLCQEACNLLVAEARKVVKAETGKE